MLVTLIVIFIEVCSAELGSVNGSGHDFQFPRTFTSPVIHIQSVDKHRGFDCGALKSPTLNCDARNSAASNGSFFSLPKMHQPDHLMRRQFSSIATQKM